MAEYRESLGPLMQSVTDANQDEQLKLYRRHIQVLWNHIERLERFIEVDPEGALILKVGDASITLKEDGQVSIKGGDIIMAGDGSVRITAFHKITVKSPGDIILKGGKINQN